MRFIKYFVVFVIVFTSCKTKKNLMSTNTIAEEMSAKKVARKHIASNFDKKTVEAKLKANFNNGKLKQSISVSLRMKKDEVIWLKGTKFITVFKAKITPTKVQFYSPFYKNYFDGDFTMLKNILGTDINFKQLQSMLLGEAVMDVKQERQNVTVLKKAYQLSPKKQSELFDLFFTVNPTHFKLDKQAIVNIEKQQRLEVLYPKYIQKENVLFPEKIRIKSNCKILQPNFLFTLGATFLKLTTTAQPNFLLFAK